MDRQGKAYLVGAGPGDTGLLTLRGAELLRQAEVIIYDGLVNPDLLQMARPDAEVIYGGKKDRTRAVDQKALNALILSKAREGKLVVRLKGGDPYVFGRGGEEALELSKAGIPFEVIPGVSSVEAVLNYAGIPLTHRDYCSSYTVITGHEDPERGESRLDWGALARMPGTLVVLMGLKNLRSIAGQLLAHGGAPDRPAAVVRWGTTPKQQVLEGTLGTLADKVQAVGLEPPAVIVIGEVVTLRGELDWFGGKGLTP